MSGNKKAVLDSNVIIEASKNLIDIVATLSPYSNIYISVVTYVEVIGFNFIDANEEKAVKRLLAKFSILDVTKEVADITIDYRKKKKIKLPDAFILATAAYLNADLITSNVDDFKDLDNQVTIVLPNR
jgi:hypothetical protein